MLMLRWDIKFFRSAALAFSRHTRRINLTPIRPVMPLELADPALGGGRDLDLEPRAEPHAHYL